MKKQIALLLAAAMVTAGLAGCGAKEEAPKGIKAPAQDGSGT